MNIKIKGCTAILSTVVLAACGGGGGGGASINDAETAAQVAYQAVLFSLVDHLDITRTEPFYYQFQGAPGSLSFFCDSGSATATENNQNDVTVNANSCFRDFGDSNTVEYDGIAVLDCVDVDSSSSECIAGTVEFNGYQRVITDSEGFTTEISFDGAAEVDGTTAFQASVITGNVSKLISVGDFSGTTNNDYNGFDLEFESGDDGINLSIDGEASFSIGGLSNCSSVGNVDFTTLQQLTIENDDGNSVVAGSLSLFDGNTVARVDFNSFGGATVTIDGEVSFISSFDAENFCTID